MSQSSKCREEKFEQKSNFTPRTDVASQSQYNEEDDEDTLSFIPRCKTFTDLPSLANQEGDVSLDDFPHIKCDPEEKIDESKTSMKSSGRNQDSQKTKISSEHKPFPYFPPIMGYLSMSGKRSANSNTSTKSNSNTSQKLFK